jgi:hypothetical protein
MFRKELAPYILIYAHYVLLRDPGFDFKLDDPLRQGPVAPSYRFDPRGYVPGHAAPGLWSTTELIQGVKRPRASRRACTQDAFVDVNARQLVWPIRSGVGPEP